jgi:PAS domain S-box-containing protein
MNLFTTGQNRRSRTVLAYLLAFILPALCATANVHYAPLRVVPFALYFFSVALVATIGGFPPAFVAFVCSLVFRYYALATVFKDRAIHPVDILGALLLFLCTLVISLVNQDRRRSSEELEAALAELQERTDALVDSLHSSKCASSVIDIQGDGVVRWYGGSYQVFGRPFREIESLDSLRALLHPDDQTSFPGIIDHMRTSWEPIIFEHRTVWPDGETHWLEFRGTRVRDTPHHWRGVTVDITDRKLAEFALLRSEKLAAMGRLASTVAHEINNPLESVTNLLYLARGDRSLSSQTQSYLSTAELELARLGNITRLTLGFVRNSVAGQTILIADAIEDVLSIFRHRYEMKKIHVERQFQDDVFITIASHELRQIATNLISNALDAFTGPDSRVLVSITRDDATAVLTIEDNGVGIPEAQLSRIFDPFFTTKDDVGTGIGLWVTKELIEKNSGQISVRSGTLPNGMKTSFRVEFPIAVTVAALHAPQAAPRAGYYQPSI